MGPDPMGALVSWRWLGAAALGVTLTLVGALAQSVTTDIEKLQAADTELSRTDAQTGARLSRIEADVQHLRDTTDDTREDVREIRRLLEERRK